jgi:hypothetical protein
MKKYAITCEFPVLQRGRNSCHLRTAEVFLRTAAVFTKFSGGYPAEITPLGELLTKFTDPATTVI